METLELTPTTLVRDIAVTLPGATRVFDALLIDYCCGGQRSLTDACSAVAVPVSEAVRMLEEEARRAAAEGDADEAPVGGSLSDLIEHIVQRHHTFTRDALTTLEPLVNKVCNRHGAEHPELDELQALFTALAADLEPHLAREEYVLFPYVRHIENAISAGRPPQSAPFGHLANPLAVMNREHDDAGAILKRLRELTGNYVPPEGACTSYRALYLGLAELERDLVRHVHLENNVLFPRALRAFEGVSPRRSDGSLLERSGL